MLLHSAPTPPDSPRRLLRSAPPFLTASPQFSLAMRSFILAGLVGVVTASTAATVKKVSSSTDDAFFATGDAPHCKVSSAGHTVVQFTSALHPSYKCTHNTDNTACSCVSNHPTRKYASR